MSKNLYKFAESVSREVCARPVGKLLYDYVADLLEDPAAEEFEDHLLNCRHCRREYLKLLSLRGTKGETKDPQDAEDEHTPDAPNVFSFAAFKRGGT